MLRENWPKVITVNHNKDYWAAEYENKKICSRTLPDLFQELVRSFYFPEADSGTSS